MEIADAGNSQDSRRYRLDLSYVGTAYHGWQRQENAVTVEGTLEDALLRITGLSLEVVGAGRTDTGVHAERYVAHVDLPRTLDTSQLKYKLNAVLPRDVAIHRLNAAAGDFHARHSATRRVYEYRVAQEKLPFLENRAFYYPWPLDLNAMKRAAEQLVGEREYGCFCKTGGNSVSMRCRVDESRWYEKDNLLIYRVGADRFLRNMVRAMAGTLLEVGRGRRSEDLSTLLAGGRRGAAGESVPGHGLFLIAVEYGDR